MYELVTGLTRNQKKLILLLVDIGLVPVSLWIAIALMFETLPGSDRLAESLPLLITVAVLGGLYSWAMGLPKVKLNAYESRAILHTAGFAGFCGTVALWLTLWDIEGRMSVSALIIFTVTLLVMSVATRLALRHILIRVHQRGKVRLRVLIYGAGQTGVQLATALKTDPRIHAVAFVDDNRTLQSLMVSGLPVYSSIRIDDLVRRLAIDRVVLTMPSLSRSKQVQMVRRLENLNCDVRTLPSFAMLLDDHDIVRRIQPVSPIDYLGRDNLDSDLAGLCDSYCGQSVMITGAGGSIGSELCRQIIKCAPARLVLFELNELALYQIHRELADLVSETSVTLVAVLGSVADASVVRHALVENRVQVVLHAAAYKHVPIVETNELAGLQNNVVGTKVLADAVRSAGVPRFVLVSTDKAVRPTNVMGASKRLAELVVQDLATRSQATTFSMVRFGNVLGSSGSVLPLFQEQIRRGGPVTLTDPDVSRYFMTVGEAACLVLLAGTFSRGGDVFVLDMGQPVRIARLARQLIENAGYSVRDADQPNGDIEIAVTGLRPGEKLHEELLIGSDMLPTPHPKILQAREACLSEIEMANALQAITRAIANADVGAARQTIARWVGGYEPMPALVDTAS